MKSAKQGTLTQMLGYPDSDQDFSDFVTPNPKKQKTTKSPHSKNSVHKKYPVGPKVSDLVMSTAAELHHLDYVTQKISGAYIFFGIVRSYSTEGNDDEKEKVNVDWSAVETGHTHIKSENKNILHRHPIKNYAVIVPPVSKDKVHIVAKSNNPHLLGINEWLKMELLDEFYFIENEGWRRVHALSKRSAD